MRRPKAQGQTGFQYPRPGNWKRFLRTAWFSFCVAMVILGFIQKPANAGSFQTPHANPGISLSDPFLKPRLSASNPPTDLVITLNGVSDFYVDSNKFCGTTDLQGPDGMWLPVHIRNTGASGYTYTGLLATVIPPSNVITSDPNRYIGNLAPGQSLDVFYYFDYSPLRTLAACRDGRDSWYNQPYTITLTSLNGGLDASKVFNDTFVNLNMISAQAGGVYMSDFLGPGVAVGQVFTQTITYGFGNNPAGSQLFLQPAGNGNFNDQCFRVVGSEIKASTVAGVAVNTKDTFYFPTTESANGDTVQVELRWLALCSPGATSPVFPWAEITSGTQYKYNGAGFAATPLPIPVPVTDTISITKTVNPTHLLTGGTATYTVTLTNSYSQPIYVDQITDVLPAGVTFTGYGVGSDITVANSSISPSSGDFNTINWYGISFPAASKSFLVPANNHIHLIYTVSIPNTEKDYKNSVTARIGSDSAGPATSTVTVGRLAPTVTTEIHNTAHTGVTSIVAGSMVHDSATVTGSAATPTGRVDFYFYATADCTGTSVNAGNESLGGGAAHPSFNEGPLDFGSYAFKAHYEGDGNYKPADGACEPLTVTKASPSISTIPGAGGTIGVTLTDTASLTAGYNPTGSVTFKLFSPADSTCAGIAAYTETDPTAPYVASTGFASNAIGTWHWTADYSGDANNLATSSACASESAVVNKATPILTTTASGPVVVGGTITDTAHLSGGYGTLGGTLSFDVFAPTDEFCTTPIIVGSSKPVTGTGNYTSDAYATTMVGNYRWIAHYSGDANNNAVNTTCNESGETSTIGKSSPVISTIPGAGGTIGVTLTDTASLSGGYNPTGSVTFKLFPPADSSCSGSAIYSETDATAPYAVSTGFASNVVGTWHWTADYSGDTDNFAASSACSTESVVVNKDTPTLSTTASTPVTVGDNITDTAHLSGGYGTLSGTVSFAVYAPGDTSCSSPIAVGTPLSVNGADDYASDAYLTSMAGDYLWRAFYSGDANNYSVNTACGEPGETSSVGKASPTFTTTAIPGSGTVGVESYFGDMASFTGGYNPTGTVDFALFKDNACTQPVSGMSGSDSVHGGGIYYSNWADNWTPPEAGDYFWKASYSGDVNNESYDAGCGGLREVVLISRVSPTLTTQLKNAIDDLDISDPVPFGSTLYDTAALTGGFTPGGTISYHIFSDNTCTTLIEDVTPTFNTISAGSIPNSADHTFNSAGNFWYQASYSGDINNNSAFSNCTEEPVTVAVNLIDAVNDSAGPVNGYTGATGVLNVFDNDTLNGSPVNPADISLSEQTGGDPELTLNSDGSVDVAPGTPAGSYGFDYQICEIANPTNCDIATATVTVVAPDIDAVNDSGGPINGFTGATGVLNVFDNDTLNGSPVNPAEVNLTRQPGGDSELTLNPDGSVDVALGTSEGSYSFDYQICEIVNSGNCDIATVTITVVAPVIDAVNDVGGPVNGYTGALGVLNVFSNDTLNGFALNPSDVTLTRQSGGDSELTLNPDGSVDVASGTPEGSYTFDYKICEILNPGNCDIASVTISVVAPVIDAVNDVGGPVNGFTGATGVLNVFDNDTLNGSPVNPAEVTLSREAGGDSELTLNSDGSVDVASGTSAGSYSFNYKICEIANPSNCDIATVTVSVVVDNPAIEISKTPLSQTVVTGSDVTFTLTVKNTGDVPLSDVLVTDVQCDTLSSASGDTNGNDQLDTTETWTYDCTVNGASSDFTNHASVSGTPSVGPNVTSSATADVTVIHPGIGLAKDPPTQSVVAGSDATFTLTVTNSGDVSLSGIDLSDSQCDTLSAPSGDSNGNNALDTTETWTYGCTINGVTSDFTNSANVSGTPPVGTDVTSNASADVTVNKARPTISTVPSSAGTIGITLNDTASLTGGYSPIGSVTFKLFMPSDPTCDGTAAYSETDDAAPFATSPGFVSDAVGTWHWTADYSGDANNEPASSGCSAEPVTVTKAGLSITTVASPSTGTTGANNTFGDTATFVGANNPTGSVNFTLYSDDTCSTVEFSGSGTISGGAASWSSSWTPSQAGTYYWIASYAGDANNAGFTTSCGDSNEQISIVAGLYDPPFGVKTVNASGVPVLTWTMVWINNANHVPVGGAVHDPIANGTTYVPGSIICTPASSATTVDTCLFEAPSALYPHGRIVWTGVIGDDFGATTAADAANELTISFQVTVAISTNSVQNTATIDSDLNGDGNATDPGEQNVASATASWQRPGGGDDGGGDDGGGGGGGFTGGFFIPVTGFAPGRIANLSPVAAEYKGLGDLSLVVPALGINIPVVGVPQTSAKSWDVSWLGKNAGWLAGSAFPTWNGNSVLTAHVYDAFGKPGPFIALNQLKWGDKVIVKAFGSKYIYEVREVLQVGPGDATAMMKHQAQPWLTLVTCRGYDEKSNSYQYRVLVRAILVGVE